MESPFTTRFSTMHAKSMSKGGCFKIHKFDNNDNISEFKRKMDYKKLVFRYIEKEGEFKLDDNNDLNKDNKYILMYISPKQNGGFYQKLQKYKLKLKLNNIL